MEWMLYIFIEEDKYNELFPNIYSISQFLYINNVNVRGNSSSYIIIIIYKKIKKYNFPKFYY